MRALVFLALALPLFAHQQPTTLAVFTPDPNRLSLTLHVPLSELELAFGHNATTAPLAAWQSDFDAYLTAHIRPVTRTGLPWQIRVDSVSLQQAEQLPTGTFHEALVTLALTPPPTASPLDFILHYDLILHQVVTHKAIFSVRDGSQLGLVQVNHEDGRIAPLPVHLEMRHWWSGLLAMVRLGMAHIADGTDHNLFLLVLLLPATLTSSGRTWGPSGGTRHTLVNLFKVVSAFTAGHSLTLLAAALGWLRLPPQPVEVAIAVSILISAAHAIRPLFPGLEPYVAAAFGLIHGLAFASAITDLQLPPGQLALSILGFNLGIELMQLFVLALTAPWIVLLSLTSIYAWFRISGALLACLAALGWIATRITGQPNVVEQLFGSVNEVAPVGILLLAFIAIPAYALTATPNPQPEREL